jgi:hypothetical protein
MQQCILACNISLEDAKNIKQSIQIINLFPGTFFTSKGARRGDPLPSWTDCCFLYEGMKCTQALCYIYFNDILGNQLNLTVAGVAASEWEMQTREGIFGIKNG